MYATTSNNFPIKNTPQGDWLLLYHQRQHQGANNFKTYFYMKGILSYVCMLYKNDRQSISIIIYWVFSYVLRCDNNFVFDFRAIVTEVDVCVPSKLKETLQLRHILKVWRLILWWRKSSQELGSANVYIVQWGVCCLIHRWYRYSRRCIS